MEEIIRIFFLDKKDAFFACYVMPWRLLNRGCSFDLWLSNNVKLIIILFRRKLNMKIKPLADRVLVEVMSDETEKVGSLYIPQTAQEKTNSGVIAAIGDDKDVITVKVGDKVMYDKYAGTKLEADGKDYLLVRMSDVLAVIE